MLESQTNRFSAMNASVSFSLKPIPPFRLDLTVWALHRWPNNLIDRWDGETYRRVLVVNGYPAEVATRKSGPPDSPRICVSLTCQRIASHMKERKLQAGEYQSAAVRAGFGRTLSTATAS